MALECRVRNIVTTYRGESPPTAKEAVEIACSSSSSTQTVGMQSRDATEEAVTATTVIMGRVVQYHVAARVYDESNHSVDVLAMRPVSRLGGVLYGFTRHACLIPRPRV